MNSPVLQQLLESMPGAEFERFVFDVLQGLGRFENLHLHAQLHGFEVDIFAIERDAQLQQPTTWYIETTTARVVSVDKLQKLASLLHHPQLTKDGPTRTLLVASGSLTSAARDFAGRVGFEVWDATKLAQIAPEVVLKKYFPGWVSTESSVAISKEKAASLSAALKELESGKEKALAYQGLVSEILEFLFCPPLETPRYELPDAAARNRRDMIFENAAPTGFWASLRVSYAAHYVVVDAKNYTDKIDKGPVIDIAHYLKPYGCGMFGLLATRQGPSGSGLHAIREQWIGNQKMIAVVDDRDMHEMLRVKGEGGAPEETIRAQIAAFRMSL